MQDPKIPGEQFMAADELRRLCATAFVHAGIAQDDAEIAAEILVFADLVGISTHGVRRLVPYIARLRSGAFNAKPEIEVQRNGSTAVVNGGDGLGPVVGRKGLDIALDIAAETGVAYVGCRASQHFGALAPYIKRATDRGMVIFLGSNAFPSMAPWGGAEVALGNNPLGFGAPREAGFPMMLDIALSVVARGKIRTALEAHTRLPEGWALDRSGEPTTDPEEALRGIVLPIGGHKGYGLALMVDVLAAALTGERASARVRSLFQQTEKPQKVSHFFIVIDPERTVGSAAFAAAMRMLEEEVKGVRPQDPSSPVLVPGDIEWRLHDQRTGEGIPLPDTLVESIRRLARGERVDEASTV